MSISTLLSTSITNIDNMSTLLMAPQSTHCSYPPTSMIGLIAEHDRPYSQYGHLSMRVNF